MQLGDDFLEVMSDVLHELPNIEHLNLASNKLSDEAMEKLVVVSHIGSSHADAFYLLCTSLSFSVPTTVTSSH